MKPLLSTTMIHLLEYMREHGELRRFPGGAIFETERDALEYALKQMREAREVAEREYKAILDRIDAMETQEVAREEAHA